MGIDGLHGVLKPYCLPSHVRELAGHRVGVDAWSWLHRGAVGAARELATGERPWEERGFDAPHVEFCLKMCRVLQAASVTPVLVFDGCRLPAKAATNQQRRQRRADAKERAQKLLEEGREQEAQGVFMQCVDVTADMAHEVAARLRERGVEFVVAPYEADPQLAYLSSIPEREGGIAAVITEDSDLVAYGCRRVLFKMDTSGNCLDLSLDRLFAGPEAAAAAADGAAAGSGGRGAAGVVSLRGFTLEMLQAASVLAGCDFAPSLKGISFRTAAGLVARRRSLDSVLRLLRAEKRWQLAATDEYCAAARRAALAFKHALVFCANTAGGSCRRLTPLPPPAGQQRGAPTPSGGSRGSGQALECADLSHLGAELAPDVARGIAYGYLHPHTLEPFPPAAPGRRGSHDRQRESRQQAGQPVQASLASRRQLGSWVAGGAAAAPGQHGLGPSQHAATAPLQPMQPWQAQQARQQQRGSRGGADVSDVVQMYAPHQAAASGQQQGAAVPQAGTLRQRAHNPFARHQPVAAPEPPTTAMGAAAPGQHGSFRPVLGEPVQAREVMVVAAAAAAGSGPCAPAAAADAAEQEEPCGSWEEASTAVPADVAGAAGGGGGAQERQQARQRLAMQSITNLSSQQLASQQPQSCGTAVCAGSPSLGSASQQQQQQQQQQAAVWDRSEQYRQAPRKPLAATTGSKRKSSGGGSGTKKAAGKPLAPPAQRISRFFLAAAKQQ